MVNSVYKGIAVLSWGQKRPWRLLILYCGWLYDYGVETKYVSFFSVEIVLPSQISLLILICMKNLGCDFAL